MTFWLIYFLIGVVLSWNNYITLKNSDEESVDIFSIILTGVVNIVFWPIIELGFLIFSIKIIKDIFNDPWANLSDIEGEVNKRLKELREKLTKDKE